MNSKKNLKKIIKYYNRKSKIIDVSNLTEAYQNYLKAEESFLKKRIPNEANIIEIGAGQGRIIDTLNNGKRNITGIEITNLLFLKNKYKKEPNIKILRMDAHELNLKDKSFDICLIMYNTLGLMHNPLKVIKECKRVTRKRGTIIISTYTLNEEYAFKERIKCFTKIGHKIKNIKSLNFEVSKGIASHYFRKDELDKLFKNANLKPTYHQLSKLGCIWIVKVL